MERTTLTERLRRVEAEIAAGRPEQALAACQELQAEYPRALRVQRTLGQIYLALRRPREALATLDRALAGDPEDVRACCARALVHQMHGDDGAALAWYRRACDLRPDDQALRATFRDLAHRLGEPPYRPSRAGLARLYLRGDLLAHAIREWEQLVAESPDRLDAQVGLAETLWIAGHAEAAEDRCRRILANAPFCVKAMLILMALALSDGDMDTARAHLERTLQLDPDMTIAQMCFSDALAAGDPVMTALLRPGAADLADEATMRHPTAGFAQSAPLAGQRNLSRPLVTSAPHTGHTGGPAIPPPQPQSSHQTSPLPPPPRPDVPVPSQPTEVTRAFRETAFMIWDEDDDSQPRLAAQQPQNPRNGDQSPPAVRALSNMNDDEERRRALNWFNWLQSQGAVSLRRGTGGPPPGAPPSQAPGNIPAPRPPTTGNLGAFPTEPAPANGPAQPLSPAAAIPPVPPVSPAPPALPAPPMPPAPSAPSGPLHPTAPFAMTPRGEEPEPETAPLPSADALRTMFAELGGNTAGQPVIEAETPPSMTADETRAPDDGAASAPGMDDLSAALWPAAPSFDAPEEDPGGVYDAGDALGADDVHADVAMGRDDRDDRDHRDDRIVEADEAPQTIEDLERQFAASGFTPVATRPGLLAEMEREQPNQPEQSEQTEQPHEQASEPALIEAAEPVAETTARAPSEPIPSGPDPRDYPARLAHARQRRGDGQLDDALNEYRAIIKNAPDLLSEVLSDLRASLEEMPDHPNLHSVLGDALVCQGDYEGALEEYNRATALAQARNG